MFLRRPKNRYLVLVEITTLSAVPYINGHYYCKLRLLSCGGFEARTDCKPIQNNIVNWNKQFQFEIKTPEASKINEAKLRISVRREASGGKSEVKIGYIDFQLAQFSELGRSHQGVLHGYEKTKQRQDNSILKVSLYLNQIQKNPNQPSKMRTKSSIISALDSKVPIAQDKDIQRDTWSVDLTAADGRYRRGHSRNSSGASGYSSSTNSEKPFTHQRTTSLDKKHIDNTALVDSLFNDYHQLRK